MPIGLVREPIYQEHDNGPYHPESGVRLKVADQYIDSWTGRDILMPIAARKASHQEIARVHTMRHVEKVAATSGKGGFFDADTSASPQSYQAALMASGGLLNLVDAAFSGQVQHGLALLRPPGHHATRGRAMGFCLYNNVAVAAAHLLEEKGLDRVLIVDWDVHHGNGTEAIFYEDPRVMYFSTHQTPFYPGTGPADDVGKGAGEGFNINVPMPPGQDSLVYIKVFRDLLLPLARQFEPQFILVSAGFDAHAEDPLGSMQISGLGYGALTRLLVELSRELCPGRVVLALEGGYSPEAQARSILKCLDAMAGGDDSDKLLIRAQDTTGGRALINTLRIVERYWSI
jgi:acetoin utilization deacetylase AcuC-like enzyme